MSYVNITRSSARSWKAKRSTRLETGRTTEDRATLLSTLEIDPIRDEVFRWPRPIDALYLQLTCRGLIPKEDMSYSNSLSQIDPSLCQNARESESPAIRFISSVESPKVQKHPHAEGADPT
ncbi:hypothetical protein CERZMDRAFT_87847 [Cercospora zeae-maydis SCOH1-5]|uniref:Uncharacterized protein n=1 Tax=Cercospora zeae-maydis SCOH1-5 TaxID=717836 RepID=A0A6A6F6Q4_9PEZI|nr:hypothetical protein CERZMDRAFT_87847 [Cercospora zeae-maydis SCOH1-5]